MMKTTLNLIAAACVTMVLGFGACTSDDPEVTPVNNGNPGNNGNNGNSGNVNQQADPVKLTQGILVKNKQILSGDVPENGTVEDIKISVDTIFWVDGVKNRIRFRKPPHVAFGSVSFQVEGSDSYITADLEEEEESDTVAVLYFDFDPQDLELPLTFDLKIVPNDESGTPLDTLSGPVTIEDAGSACNLNLENTFWEWIFTLMNGNFELGPMYPQSVDGTVSGCCDTDGNSYYADCINTASHRVINYESVFMVQREFLKFFGGNDFAGELYLFTQNIRPSESDFCSGSPGYSISTTHSPFVGKFSFNESECNVDLTDIEGTTAPLYTSDGTYLGDIPLPVYIVGTPYAEYKFLSPHFLQEIRGGEQGGMVRVFQRSDSEELWHD